MSLSSRRGAPVTTESRPTGPGSVPETEAVPEVRHLRKNYRATVAVDDVSFSVRDGEIFGILGPNGAGKTTTVECVIGLRCPDAGDIRVMGLDPQADREDLHMIVGAQLQASALPAQLKVGEILDLYHSFYAEAADLAEIMDSLGLAEKRNAYYRSLSGGLKQRLSMALALIGNPKVAVLDEMTTGLDPQARRDTWHLIEQVRDRGVTISLVTHYRPRAGFWQRHRGEGTSQLGSDWFSESKPTPATWLMLDVRERSI
jgi:ABC-2 type transport system ATP-binding protein